MIYNLKIFSVCSWSSFICAFWREVYSFDKFNWIVVMTWILLNLTRRCFMVRMSYGSMCTWIYILLLLSGMIYKCEVNQVDLWCCLGLLHTFWCFFLLIIPIIERGTLRFLTVILNFPKFFWDLWSFLSYVEGIQMFRIASVLGEFTLYY